MKYAISFSAVGLILLSIAILFDFNYFDYGKPIPYGKWDKIHFYDFKAFGRPGLTLNGVSEFAYIKTNRVVHYQNNGNVEITTYFYPSRSYVFARDIRNPDLLRHEIYHFHISEYCTRLMRKEIFTRENVTHNLISDLSKKYYQLESDMQQEYDENSYHGYVMKEQKKWELKVDSLLHSVQDFSDPVLSIENKK